MDLKHEPELQKVPIRLARHLHGRHHHQHLNRGLLHSLATNLSSSPHQYLPMSPSTSNPSSLSTTLTNGPEYYANDTFALLQDEGIEAGHSSGGSIAMSYIENITAAAIQELTGTSPQNATLANSSTSNSTLSAADKTYIYNSYNWAIPPMLIVCSITFVVNLVIVFSAHWCRKPMSPTLYFSISLALADAFASLVIGSGLLVNSYLPTIYDIHLAPCLPLALEAFRLGGILVTVFHLLALAINHFVGILRPLHYAATMTRRTAWIVIILSWICPILAIFIYFSWDQGFMSEGCSKYQFLFLRNYRLVFAAFLFAPLLAMSVIYLYIFIMVRDHQNHRIRFQNTQQLQRNVKAIVTTVLILGTYIIGWMPACVYFIIHCEDCILTPKMIPLRAKLPIGISINSLVILKTLVDPIIYAFRMSDIQNALRKMRYELLKRIFGSYMSSDTILTLERRASRYYERTPIETRSIRMSSVGSNSTSSSRRNTTKAIVNSSFHSSPHHHHTLLTKHNNTGVNSIISDRSKNHNGHGELEDML